MAIFYAFFSYAGGEKNIYFKIRPTASVRKVESSLCPHIDNVYFQVFLSVGNTGFFPSRWHIATYQFLALSNLQRVKRKVVFFMEQRTCKYYFKCFILLHWIHTQICMSSFAWHVHIKTLPKAQPSSIDSAKQTSLLLQLCFHVWSALSFSPG